MFERLRGRRVMVAGGAGFVGSQVARECIRAGAQVMVFDNFLHGTRANVEELRETAIIEAGDVLNEWRLTDVFKLFQPQFVFDLVGDTFVPTAYDIPKRFFNINVEGTLNVLMAAKAYDVERVLYVSSTEVYGEALTVPMKEDHPLLPANTYAVSKLAADRLCYTFNKEHDIPVIIARIYNSFGPRETEPYIVPEIISQLNRGSTLTLGNLDAQRDFTFVEDTARGLLAAMCSDIPDGEAVNVGSGKAISVRALAHEIADVMGITDVNITVDPARLRRLDVELFLCDNTRLREATGWSPQVEMRDGLERTVAWFHDNGSKWSWEDWTVNGRTFDAVG